MMKVNDIIHDFGGSILEEKLPTFRGVKSEAGSLEG
jgi:hypothetical protein